MTTKYNAHQLRHLDPAVGSTDSKQLTRNPLFLILENIYDTYNIGGLFRLADALAVQKIYLTGDTTTPPNSRIAKASCGTYKVVPWAATSTSDAVTAIRERYDKVQIIAVEQSTTSIPYHKLQHEGPTALIVGNETTGVTPATLALCDHIVEIPMWGINKSLNVIVSAAIVSYHLMSKR